MDHCKKLLRCFCQIRLNFNKPKKSGDGGDQASGKYKLVLNGNSDSGNAGKLKSVFLPYNSITLDSKAKSTLSDNADFLRANPSVILQIEGHCDERGSRQHNLALGERRAKMVRDHLNAIGIKTFRMKTISWGSEKPVSEGSDEDSWSRNRRGNFVVIKK